MVVDVVVDDVDVVVGTVQRAKQLLVRLGPLDTEGSAAAACVWTGLPAHSTGERQLDRPSNREEEVWRRDLSRSQNKRLNYGCG